MMTTSDEVPNDVSAALNLLGESLEAEVVRINDEGSQAMKQGDYDTAQAVIDFARRLQAFRGKVADLGIEWDALEEMRDKASLEVQRIVSKRFFGREGRGQITPHEVYCRYILEVLVDIGGSGTMKAVLDQVGEKMKGILKPQDYEAHESSPKQIRWRNHAQWARNKMVNDDQDGRMKKSPRGTWEISQKGRNWLKDD